MRIRDIFDPRSGIEKFESGMEKIESGMEKFESGIWYKHYGSATLLLCYPKYTCGLYTCTDEGLKYQYVRTGTVEAF
jgi:hypothetical protein